MEFEKLTEESKYFLNLIESQVSSDFKINISHHSKSIRDIMDNLEGHLHKCLNKNNRYDHNTLKHDAPHMSIKAVELRKRVTKSEFNRMTHREHAKPFKIVMAEIAGLKGQLLLDYIWDNIKSVTIMKDEQKKLDTKFKTTMPNLNDVFSRFSATGIEIIQRK